MGSINLPVSVAALSPLCRKSYWGCNSSVKGAEQVAEACLVVVYPGHALPTRVWLKTNQMMMCWFYNCAMTWLPLYCTTHPGCITWLPYYWYYTSWLCYMATSLWRYTSWLHYVATSLLVLHILVALHGYITTVITYPGWVTWLHRYWCYTSWLSYMATLLLASNILQVS